MDLSSDTWVEGEHTPPGWVSEQGRLRRTIRAESPEDGSSIDKPALEEYILRFPSAPIHGMQRLHEYHGDQPASLNLHTYRILTASPREPITRIFLIHNGLNELDKLGFYHDLASYLITNGSGVACILRPFPSHLTRAAYPLQYAETPLQRYLWDGSHLFQQFMRYMVETQWFLSALVPCSHYQRLTGVGLLGEDSTGIIRRLTATDLARRMKDEFDAMNQASDLAMDKIRREQKRAREIEKAPNEDVFRDVIQSLRYALDSAKRPVSLHVLGYSLGGFTAQSVFMSWPSLIASCSTLLSGGALRELTPTAFANHEEWQTALHSLRYELDDWMLRYMRDGKTTNRDQIADQSQIAGLPLVRFRNFQRTFYEVFQQEYRGSHRTRLAAFVDVCYL